MNRRNLVQLVVGTVAALLFGPTVNANPKEDGLAHAFTSSLVEITKDRDTVLAKTQSDVVPQMAKAGATLYSIWIPPEKLPKKEMIQGAKRQAYASFQGLNDNQLSVMFAWPKDKVRTKDLDDALCALDGVKKVTTRTFDPIFLAKGLMVPTGRGFYVHRENRYLPKDVPTVMRLTKEAWKTFNPHWGTKPTGIFRQRLETDEYAQLMRIFWYPSTERWIESRNAKQDPESLKRFRERAKLQIKEGVGGAIATDRVVVVDE